jgi:hypothetical protein
MGFTISNYSLFGLQPQNFYVSILGSYTIKKNHPVIGHYTISYTIYYSSSKAQPVITKKDAYFSIEHLPEPANIYTVIYNEIKKDIDPQYSTSTNAAFTDD